MISHLYLIDITGFSLFVQFWMQFRAHHYVFLLYDCRNGTTIPEIYLVEEVLDRLPNGAIHCHFHSSIPTVVQRMRLSKRIHGLDWFAWSHVFVFVFWFLQIKIYIEIKQNTNQKWHKQRHFQRSKYNAFHSRFLFYLQFYTIHFQWDCLYPEFENSINLGRYSRN